MRYRIRHKTAFRYSEPASLSQNELFLQPRETPSQKVIQYDLAIQPEPQYLQRRNDYFGNMVQVFMVQQPHDTLTVTAASVATFSIASTSFSRSTEASAWHSPPWVSS